MKCSRENCKNNAVVHPVFGVLPCLVHQKEEEKYSPHSSPEFTSLAKMSRVQRQRDVHARDLLQPFTSGGMNPEFAKAYRKQAPNYFKKEELAKI